MLTWVLFRCLFPALFGNSRNKHHNNTRACNSSPLQYIYYPLFITAQCYTGRYQNGNRIRPLAAQYSQESDSVHVIIYVSTKHHLLFKCHALVFWFLVAAPNPNVNINLHRQLEIIWLPCSLYIPALKITPMLVTKNQQCGVLIVCISAWTHISLTNNRVAGDLWRHDSHVTPVWWHDIQRC